MLSKLTFSLASLIVLLMVGLCLPASAQIIQVPTRVVLPQPPDPDAGGDLAAGTIPAMGFIVYSEAAQADSGVGAGLQQIPVADADMPDLEAFFRFGGTLALIGPASIDDGADPPVVQETLARNDLVISEIMWALDVDNPGDAEAEGAASSNTRRQWIEIYNTKSDANGRPEAVTDIPEPGNDGVGLSLVFIPYRHVEGDVSILAAVEGIPAGHIVLDVMSNLQFGRWDMPGMNGNTTPPTLNPQDPPLAPLASAYRNINYDRVQGINVLNNDNTVNTALNRAWQIHQNDSIRDGYNPGSWVATNALGRRNTISGLFVGSPGAEHIPGLVYTGAIRDTLPTVDDAPAIIITEVRNDSSPANIDWVELHNYGTEPVGLWDWELTLLQSADGDDPGADIDASDTDTVLVGFDEEYTPAERLARGFPPNRQFRLESGGYLLIVNRDPRETVLAGGVNVDEEIAGRNVPAGTSHQYIVRPMLNLPAGNISLVLRNHVGRNAQHARPPNKHRVADARATTNTDPSLNIVDYVGGLQMAVITNEYNTQVWPFRGWTTRTRDDGHGARGIPHNTNQSIARRLTAEDSTIYRLGNDGAGDDRSWDAVGTVGGLGYDPGVDRSMAPGTPGYANNPVRNSLVDDAGTLAVATDDLTYDGEISISEVMVDAGPRWNLIQWIEIYNSSMTQVVDLAGWEMEIRNATDDVESYVDSGFGFRAGVGATILPNQTLLIVSGTGTNDVSDNRVYNLYEHHRRDLGLTNRRSVLLSPGGFYLKLFTAM